MCLCSSVHYLFSRHPLITEVLDIGDGLSDGVSVILSNHHDSISAVWSTDGSTEQSAPSTPLVLPVV